MPNTRIPLVTPTNTGMITKYTKTIDRNDDGYTTIIFEDGSTLVIPPEYPTSMMYKF